MLLLTNKTVQENTQLTEPKHLSSQNGYLGSVLYITWPGSKFTLQLATPHVVFVGYSNDDKPFGRKSDGLMPM